MGTWEYYTIKMSMKELSANVHFAKDIYDERTLDDAIQRVLSDSRVNREIVTYLIKQEDRFFSAVVIACLGGHPDWYPVSMQDDARFMLLKNDKRLSDTFGVIVFDGTQNYYALDGQHRLAAIRKLVDPQSDVRVDAPTGFEDEEMTVILVVPKDNERDEDFFIRYRRLFGHLNRYARKTDTFTDIVMDEDDAVAISTRQLISEHEFFKWSGPDMESPRLKMKPGKNVRSTEPFFTSLEQLYSMNIQLLTGPARANEGWFAPHVKLDEFLRFRPDDEVISQLNEELMMYWTGLCKALPEMANQATEMRNHSAEASDDETMDSALFWPICQDILAQLSRLLLNRQRDPGSPSQSTVDHALKPLRELCWDLHSVPWRNLALVNEPDNPTKWKMRSEDRKPALSLVLEIMAWQAGLWRKEEDEIDELRGKWEAMLYPRPSDDELAAMWTAVLDGVVR